MFKGHAHWVNTLALSSEGVLRTGAFDHRGSAPADLEEARESALTRYEGNMAPWYVAAEQGISACIPNLHRLTINLAATLPMR